MRYYTYLNVKYVYVNVGPIFGLRITIDNISLYIKSCKLLGRQVQVVTIQAHFTTTFCFIGEPQIQALYPWQ